MEFAKFEQSLFGVGWDGDVNVPVMRMMLRCSYWLGWGWVGWGGDVNVPVTRVIFAFVCGANWGIGKTLQNLVDLASTC